mmetsp:Transcript_32086/g.76254  ORF Transcript_32086/g.76254 Transcript_32086/m.76254 type:complete len:218 (+) Transcript_32086:620-1273(+)
MLAACLRPARISVSWTGAVPPDTLRSPARGSPWRSSGTPVQLQQTAAAAPLSARGVSGEWPQCHASQGVPVPLRARTGEEAAPGRAGRQPTRMHRQALPGLTGRGGLSGHTMLDLPAIIQQQMQHRWDALLAPPKQRGGIWQARAFRALPVRPPLLLRRNRLACPRLRPRSPGWPPLPPQPQSALPLDFPLSPRGDGTHPPPRVRRRSLLPPWARAM